MRSLFVCGVAALVLASSDASAQTEAVKAQAIARYQEGVALHEKGQEEEAYLRFAQAYAVVQTPPILFNLARTEQLTGRRIAASGHFRAYLALPEHPRVTKELRAKAQGFLNDLSAQLCHITPDVPTGAIVSVDGKDVVVSGVVDADPGTHTVGARVGEQRGSVQVVAAAGATVTAKVVFEVPVAVVAPVVVPPVPVVTPPEGPVMKAGVEPAVPPAQEPYWNGRRTGGVVIAGVGVVGMVIGGVFGAERAGETSDANAAAAKVKSDNTGSVPAKSACTNPSAAGAASCSALSNALQSNGNDARLETELLVGGGALVVIGVVTMLWPSFAQPTATTGLAPTAGAGGYGLQWSGKF